MSTDRAACPDCPATRAGVLRGLVAPPGGTCAFQCIAVRARQPLPPDWALGNGLALVRRGVVVRLRVDSNGSTTAIDAVGPGAAVPLSRASDGAGYAADDALLCVCPGPRLGAAVDAGAPASGQVVGLHEAALDRVERIAAARGRPTALSRTAAVLCALTDTLSPPRKLDVLPASLQQRDLAALLSMRHESVCRAFAALARRGLIEKTAEGTRIADRTALESLA